LIEIEDWYSFVLDRVRADLYVALLKDKYLIKNKIMRLKNSFTKLGLMASFVALLFISCKKDDNGKSTDGTDDKVGTATAMIKVDDQAAVKFESIPMGDYHTSFGGFKFKLAALTKNDNLSLAFINDKNYKEEGPGIGIFLGVGKFTGKGEYPISESTIDEGMVVDGNLGLLFIPEGKEGKDVFGTGEFGDLVGTGSINVTEVTTDRIKGTFSITMHNLKGEKVVISDGKFDVPLTREK
jgi:hypothetical protein